MQRKRMIKFIALALTLGTAGYAVAERALVHVHEVKAFAMEKPRRFAKKVGEVRFGQDLPVVKEDEGSGWILVDLGGTEGWIPSQAVSRGAYTLRAGSNQAGAKTDRESVQLAARGFSPEVEAEHKKNNPTLDYALVDAVEATIPDPEAVVQFASDGAVKLGEATP